VNGNINQNPKKSPGPKVNPPKYLRLEAKPPKNPLDKNETQKYAILNFGALQIPRSRRRD